LNDSDSPNNNNNPIVLPQNSKEKISETTDNFDILKIHTNQSLQFKRNTRKIDNINRKNLYWFTTKSRNFIDTATVALLLASGAFSWSSRKPYNNSIGDSSLELLVNNNSLKVLKSCKIANSISDEYKQSIAAKLNVSIVCFQRKGKKKSSVFEIIKTYGSTSDVFIYLCEIKDGYFKAVSLSTEKKKSLEPNRLKKAPSSSTVTILQLDSTQQIATAEKMLQLAKLKSPQLENNDNAIIPEPNHPVLNINPAPQLNDMDVVTNETAKEDKYPHNSSPSEPLVDYDEMTVPGLRKLWKTIGLKGQSTKNKPELVAMLKARDDSVSSYLPTIVIDDSSFDANTSTENRDIIQYTPEELATTVTNVTQPPHSLSSKEIVLATNLALINYQSKKRRAFQARLRYKQSVKLKKCRKKKEEKAQDEREFEAIASAFSLPTSPQPAYTIDTGKTTPPSSLNARAAPFHPVGQDHGAPSVPPMHSSSSTSMGSSSSSSSSSEPNPDVTDNLGEIGMVTRKLGFIAAVNQRFQGQGLVDKVNQSSAWLSEVKSRVYLVLNVMILLIAETNMELTTDKFDPPKLSSLFKTDTIHYKAGTLITKELIDHIFTACYRGTVKNAYEPIIEKAMNLVFPIGSAARTAITNLHDPPLYPSVLQDNAVVEILTSVKNWFSFAQAPHQTVYLSSKYNINKSQAKKMGKRIGNSKQGLHQSVVDTFTVSLNSELRHLEHSMRRLEAKKKEQPLEAPSITAKIKKLREEFNKKAKEKNSMTATKISDDAELFKRASTEHDRVNRLKGEFFEPRSWKPLTETDGSEPKKARFSKKKTKKKNSNKNKKNNKNGTVESRVMKEYIEIEKNLTPEQEDQYSLIKYNYQILQCIEANDVNSPKFSLCPSSDFTRHFIAVSKGQLPRLLPLSQGRKILASLPHANASADCFYFDGEGEEEGYFTTDEDGTKLPPSVEWDLIIKNIDLHDAMPYIFDDKLIARFVKKSASGVVRRFGPTFKTDGASLCLSIISMAQYNLSEKKQQKSREVKAVKKIERGEEAKEVESRKKAAEEDAKRADYVEPVVFELPEPVCGENFVDPKAEEKKRINNDNLKSIKKTQIEPEKRPPIQRPTAEFAAADLGLHNILAVCFSDPKRSPMVFPRSKFDANVGCKKRIKEMQRDKEKRQGEDAAFKNAVSELTTKTIKTADRTALLKGVQSRIVNFGVLFSFYGSTKHALDKFLNFSNRQREIDRMINEIFEEDLSNLIVGDATMPKGLKGSQTSVDAQIIKRINLRKGSDTVIPISEHRTSMICSITGKEMTHPLAQNSKKKMEKTATRRKEWERREEEKKKAREENERKGIPVIDFPFMPAGLPPEFAVGITTADRELLKKSKGGGIFRGKRWEPPKLKEGEGWKKGEKPTRSRIHGIYQSSMPGHTYFWNRDINAAINIMYIYLHLLDFEIEPWEFRKSVELMKIPDYCCRNRLRKLLRAESN